MSDEKMDYKALADRISCLIGEESSTRGADAHVSKSTSNQPMRHSEVNSRQVHVYNAGNNTPAQYSSMNLDSQSHGSYSPSPFHGNFNIESITRDSAKKIYADDAASSIESGFHTIVKEQMIVRNIDGTYGKRLSNDDHANVAHSLHDVAVKTLYSIEEAIDREVAALGFNAGGAQPQSSSVGALELLLCQAERDLWRLLEISTQYNFLVNIDETASEANLLSSVKNLPVTASAGDVFNCAFQNDTRFRKVCMLRAWLETAAESSMFVAPANGIPWQDTMAVANRHGHLSGQDQISSVHPDAQITLDGRVMPLKGGDDQQYTQLMKSMWTFVRCGKRREASVLAKEHQAFWLFTSLFGSEDYIDDLGEVEDDISNMRSQLDCNFRRSMWISTAWAYSDRLASCEANLYPDSGSAYEMALYATLSGNGEALCKSPTLEHWRDRIWALLVATFERDWDRILDIHTQRKQIHSGLYLECEEDERQSAEKLRELRRNSFFADFSVSNCATLLETSNMPDFDSVSSASDVEHFLLSAQAAVLRGVSGLNAWIGVVLKRTVIELQRQNNEARARLARVCCHLSLWLRHSRTFSEYLSEHSDELHFGAISVYVRYLIETGQRELVAVYVVHLPQARRVREYASLLRSISVTMDTSSDAMRGALALAGEYFDKSEVLLMAECVSRMDCILDSAGDDEAELSVGQIYSGYQFEHSKKKLTASPQRTPEDMQADTDGVMDDDRLSTFKWLLLNPDHRVDAVHRATRVLATLFQEDRGQYKTTFIKYVREVFSSLPEGSEMVCEKLLQEKKIERSSTTYRRWVSNWHQLLFWKVCSSAFSEARKIDQISDSNNLQDCADSASIKLKDALLSKLNGSQSYPKMWNTAEDLALRSAAESINELKGSHAFGATCFDLENVDSLHERLQSVKAKVERNRKEYDSIVLNDLGIALEDLSQMLALKRDDASFLQGFREALERCEESLAEASDLREVRKQAVYWISSLYLDVCEETASRLRNTNGSDKRVHYWYTRGCDIANVLADPDPAMNLYRVLSADELKPLLARIGKCAFEATNISGGL
jgi:hypothetical protein